MTRSQRLPARAVRRALTRSSALGHAAADPLAAVRAVGALHATDPATVVLSVWARTPVARVDAVADELQRAFGDERTLVRVLAMRRTLHGVARGDVGIAVAIAAARVAPTERRRSAELLTLAGAGGERAFDAVADRVLAALGDEDLPMETLVERVPELGLRVAVAEGKPYSGVVSIGRYVLDALGAEGHTVRARALGGWRANGCTWARRAHWLPEVEIPPARDGYRAWVARWLQVFGPGSPSAIAWWTGLPKRDVATAIAELGSEVAEVEVEGLGAALAWRSGLDGLRDEEAPAPAVALLPGLDPLVMSRPAADRRLYLADALAPVLFDRSGNAGPTVWWDGRIVGAWATAPDGQVRVRILDDGTDVDPAAVDAEASRLTEALAGTRISPRFAPPLTRSLGSG